MFGVLKTIIMNVIFPYSKEGVLEAQAIRKQFIKEYPHLSHRIVIAPNQFNDACLYYLKQCYQEYQYPEHSLNGEFISRWNQSYKNDVKEVAVWHIEHYRGIAMATRLHIYIENEEIDFTLPQ